MIAGVTAIKPFPVSPMRRVPPHIARPAYVGRDRPEHYDGSHVQTAETIEKMRVAGRIAAQAMAAGAAVIA
ncbi:MAG: type I methionyl aminopeptidase, partial [Phenylobacterium zucineum]